MDLVSNIVFVIECDVKGMRTLYKRHFVFEHYLYVLISLRSVIQSDGDSFRRDVVLYRFNKVSRGYDNILGQTFKNPICSEFYYEEVELIIFYENAYQHKSSNKKQSYEYLALEDCNILGMYFLQQFLKLKIFIKRFKNICFSLQV